MKTLYVNLGGEEVASDAQVEVVKVDLDFNFWLYLGEQLSSGLQIESRSALLGRFVEECPEAAEPLLATWEKLKEQVLGDSPSGRVSVTLGNGYFQWLKFSDMPQPVRNRYRDREELTLDVDVAELAEMVFDDVRRILRRNLDDTIEEVVFNHPAVTHRSPLVRFLKKSNEDLVFVQFDRWTWPEAPLAESHVEEVHAPDSNPAPAQPEAESSRCYKVGDYYHENGKEGIVFDVDASGRHGKIVALQDLSEKLAWRVFPYDEVCIGAYDKEDGMKNLEVVRRIPDWQKKFPAFAGCTALGKGWYLPTYKEWEKIRGKQIILRVLPIEYIFEEYWCSSENDEKHADSLRPGISASSHSTYKSRDLRVRAVAAF